MTTAPLIIAGAVLVFAVIFAAALWQAWRRNLQCWLGTFLWWSLRDRSSRGLHRSEEVHVLLCIADHFEPAWGGASGATADVRVAAWVNDYPRLLGAFRDSDGRPPRHTFFYPIDQYESRQVDALATLCRQGFGEIEVHLHHDHDTGDNLERTLRDYVGRLSNRHSLLGRWPDGRPAYGFIHGNWALCNSRRDGRWCGVDNELEVLRRTGCYADFTLPSAPDQTQTSTINSIYYACDNPPRHKPHNKGVHIGSGPQPAESLLLIQGPLRLHIPASSLRPRIENGCIQKGQPPSEARLEQWLRANVHVPTRPDWVFVKLHTHGATESNRSVLIGDPMVTFHRLLAQKAAQNSRFHFHYVSAREMYNLAKAAEAGWTGSVASALNQVVSAPI